MPDDKHILLQKWLRGETTAREEARLAAWASEDPFLADALEGYTSRPEADHTHRLEQLKKQLAGRREKRDPIPVWWPRIAAAAAVLLLAVAGFWWINTGNREAGVAQEMEAPPPPSTDAFPADTIAANEPSPTSLAEEAEPQPEPPAVKPRPPGAARTQSPPDKAPKLAQKEKKRIAPEAEPPAPAEEDLAEAEAFNQSEAASAAGPVNAPAERLLSGRVVNPEGAPLIGAAVLLIEPNRLSTTDQNGYFNLSIPDTAPPDLIVSYTGFESRRIQMTDTSFMVIALQEGARPLNRPSRARTGPRQPAEPMGGLTAYRQFLARNKIYPDAARQEDIRGSVQLSFQIDEEGRPRDIRVEQSLGFGCDEEAIRLLQMGPDWMPATDERTLLEIAFP